MAVSSGSGQWQWAIGSGEWGVGNGKWGVKVEWQEGVVRGSGD